MILNPEHGLYERDGKPFCSSRQIAETFEKRHDNVLQAIREKIADADKVAPEFSGANFIEIKYKDRGKQYPELLIEFDERKRVLSDMHEKVQRRIRSVRVELPR